MTTFGSQGSNDRETEYATPRSFLQPIEDAVGGFDLDPCSGAEESPHAKETFTAADDGLSRDWFGTVWCNPPFSDKGEWLAKARAEHREDHTDLVLVLLPVDTSTGWFHEHVVEADVVWFKHGRLAFDGSDDWSPNFGIMLAVYGEPPGALLDLLSQRGAVWQQSGRHQLTEQRTLAEVDAS